MTFVFGSVVYEYAVNGQLIMMDKEDNFILWSSLWKVNVSRILQLRPDLSREVRIIKVGDNEIHGTWMPFHVRSTIAWPIKEQLTPFFG
ncbi:uncharacterized protein C8R40DRAFT_1050768 [Lentinula edodes]|uniref:uncharacterized protein n=1 Tax=Lentinula edodes TaxID=5353 RepID=UPI001E8E2C4D|nr:uncharacterized protein C8R40DRAFT_1050768 [Lentinula edodes]KAH7873094.1 hypothetical protein C8R40DRAFT_1050768 [Lentinula edodes]